MKSVFLLVVLCFWYVCGIVGQRTSNYCSPTLCSGLKHIACNHDGEFGSQCFPDRKLLDIKVLKHIFVNRHNRYRNAIAGGNIPGFDNACRMGTMRWDPELEYLASLNAMRCDFDHDECRNADRYKQSGQNLAWRWDPPNEVPSLRNAIIWAIDYWFSEYLESDMSQINNFSPGHGTEHFTVMVAEHNIAMGCSALNQTDGDGIVTYVVCNYATTNIIDEPIYRFGTPVSECQTGKNPKFPNLCAVNEIYSVKAHY